MTVYAAGMKNSSPVFQRYTTRQLSSALLTSAIGYASVRSALSPILLTTRERLTSCKVAWLPASSCQRVLPGKSIGLRSLVTGGTFTGSH